jgi:glycogen operon protein
LEATKQEGRKLDDLVADDFEFSMGSPSPLGASLQHGGVNFAIFSKHAASVTLVLFAPDSDDSIAEFPLDPHYNRTGQIWHAMLRGIGPGIHYGYRMAGEKGIDPQLHRFDPSVVLLDPSAKCVAGRPVWGYPAEASHSSWKPSYLRRAVVIDDAFEWQLDKPLNIPLSDSILYEVHLRGFTQHPSSALSSRGTFSGLIEKIPYLKNLGITAVELLPVNEFEETQADQINPNTGERLLNYWGYQPVAFAAPKTSYSTETQADGPVLEFKRMVRELHKAGIEIILDIVFNHTAEGNASGPTLSFRGIDNCVYYMLDQETGAYLDYSGCGNTLNCNHPVVREMVLRCLRYWVTEMHVDGFRFDLASILGRAPNGEVLPNAPLLEMIAADPVLSDTKLIAEAWDAAGLYQVGRFPSWGRWAEWNGAFRDDIRRFVRGDAGMVPALATRLLGSPDLYEPSHRAPQHSINFVTCHDGFTLTDLVSFNQKHNETNGEGNRDGTDCNWSWNCGAEGNTQDPEVLRLRTRQAKNFAALLLLSHGVPLILAGDERRRSQQGNNNAYCQDNQISWVNWNAATAEADMLRFFRLLIEFRKNHPSLRPRSFQTGPRVEWHGIRIGQPDWSEQSRSLAMHLYYRQGEVLPPENVYLIANEHWEPHRFELPALLDQNWHRFLDTTLDSPLEISEIGAHQTLADQKTYQVGPRSVVVLVGIPILRAP